MQSSPLERGPCRRGVRSPPQCCTALLSSACTSGCPLACRGPGGLPPPQLNHFALSLAPPAELPCLVQLLSPLPSTFGDGFLPFLLSQSKLFSFPLCLRCSQGQGRRWPHPGGVRRGAGSWHSQPCLEPRPLPRCRLPCWECCPQRNSCCGLITFAGLYSFFYCTHFLYLFPFRTHNWNIQMKM